MILLKKNHRSVSFRKKRLNHDSFKVFEEKFNIDVIRFFKNFSAEISFVEERSDVDNFGRALYISYSKQADLSWAHAQLRVFKGDIEHFARPLVRMNYGRVNIDR